MKASTAVTLAGVTVAGGVLAYAVYFDFKRRNDTDFRKKLRKEKKRLDKQAAQSKVEDDAATSPTTEQLRAALAKLQKESLPETPQEKEHYFMTQVGLGEQLTAQGPAFNLPSALAFYRALRVYPSPVELIVLYEKTVPQAVFKIVMELMNLDVQKHDSGYYEKFPSRSMNVSVKQITEPVDRRTLILEKDVEEGDVVYTELPAVAVLDPDLQGTGKYCTHCLRSIDAATAVIPPSDRLDSVFCSKACESKCKVHSQNLLFGLEPILPLMFNPLGAIPGAQESRNNAQTDFVEYIKSTGKSVPLLVARFAARQVDLEIKKMIPREMRPGYVDEDVPEVQTGEFSMYDHVERLRFIDTEVSEQENKTLSKVLEAGLPGLDQFLGDQRHAMLKGKMRYNAIGVCYDGGRDDKPAPTDRPEDAEKSRTPHGTSRQIGSGLYVVSSYINHSCAPSARISFDKGTSELHLIAARDLKKGDEITMAYVDVNQHPDESPEEARRRRRQELARGWKFACTCEKCLADGPARENDPSTLGVAKDESKSEKVVDRA